MSSVTVQERLGILFILVGPGGVGKNSLMGEALKQIPSLKQLPTATTRSPRGNEVHGVQHLFISLDEFRQMIANDELLEHQEVHPGKFYGVPRSTVENAIYQHQDLIADIDFKGATILRSIYPAHTLAIFVAPPSLDSLETRLRDRQDDETDIQNRLNRMADEMLYAPTCDYVIVNDSFEQASDELTAILRSTHQGQPPFSAPYAVEFWVEVYLMRDGALLSSEGQPLRRLLKRTEPSEGALALLKDQFSADIDKAKLRYASPNAQLKVDFEIDNDRYHVVYRYTYEV
jgi:guanylate kinase